jgi:aryl-alcohol dehydrogenase-like predicted oxidoreductase
MEKRQIGNSDLQVSIVGLGGNVFGPPRLDQEGSDANIHRAQDVGINFIDTAAIYGQGHSEELIGNALKGRRNEWVIATKFTLKDLGDETPTQRIVRQTNESLKFLQTDHIDLMQIHFPEPNVPPEVILEALNDFVKEGKVRYIGECNYSSWRHAETVQIARQNGWPEMVSAQNHYNLVRRHVELELLPYCNANNVSFIPYFPLGAGVLTGKYRPGEPAPEGTRGAAGSPAVTRVRTPRNEEIAEQLKVWAEKRGHTLAELAIVWLLSRPALCSVITGTSSVAQVEANAKAAEWVLTPEEVTEVDEIAKWDGSGEGTEGEGTAGAGRSPGAGSPRPRQ